MAQRGVAGAAALSRTRFSRLFCRPPPTFRGMRIGRKGLRRAFRGLGRVFAGGCGKRVPYCITFQRETCSVRAGARLRQCRADSISASLAPWLRAHISAAEAEYLAT